MQEAENLKVPLNGDGNAHHGQPRQEEIANDSFVQILDKEEAKLPEVEEVK